MFLKITIAAGILAIYAGFTSINSEPSISSALFFGGSLSLFFILIGMREWMQNFRITAYIIFGGSLLLVIAMIRQVIQLL